MRRSLLDQPHSEEESHSEDLELTDFRGSELRVDDFEHISGSTTGMYEVLGDRRLYRGDHLAPKLWRSVEMVRRGLFMDSEAAFGIVDAMGHLGVVEFRDLNHGEGGAMRPGSFFLNEVKRCEEAERKCRLLRRDLQRAGLGHLVVQDFPMASSSSVVSMDKMESVLEDFLQRLSENSASLEQLQQSRKELLELACVLDFMLMLFKDHHRPHIQPRQHDAADRLDLMLFADEGIQNNNNNAEHDFDANNSDDEEGVGRQVVCGITKASSFFTFERILWRATRGNMFLKWKPVTNEVAETSDEKLMVFAVFTTSTIVEKKAKRICEAFGARLYVLPHSSKQQMQLRMEIDVRVAEAARVIELSRRNMEMLSEGLAKELVPIEDAVRRQKSIYVVMNGFRRDVGRRIMVAEFWCPYTQLENVVSCVRIAEEQMGANVKSIFQDLPTIEEGLVVPTQQASHFLFDSATNIVEAYAVASYREINPAVLTLVTFPILFGIMFGDVGHGLLLTLGALALVLMSGYLQRHENQLGEIGGMLFRARYLMLLMGLASIYVGFLYNEMFAIPMGLEHTKWYFPPNSTVMVKGPATWPFGVDPIWKVSENELLFYNSLKMKLSIIVAFIHMSVGIVMHGLNARHFDRKYDFWFEFVPRIVFLVCIIGYMVLLIFWKWLVPWGSVTDTPSPYIISIMIDMFLSPLSTEPQNCMIGCPAQTALQFLLLLIAIFCVPVMLLVKPILLRRDHLRDNIPFAFGEFMVHQAIETIEFVLGAVSNTASYLRLWALSLAHAELSLVFYEKVLVTGMKIAASAESPVVAAAAFFATWAVWAAFTAGVLLGMEGLSAFLHTLRLHWVEFQNKFYTLHGPGVPFRPFSHKAIKDAYLAETAGVTEDVEN